MSERPIIFSGPMVRAILDGKKTQTRRILKGSTEFKGPYNPAYLDAHWGDPGWASICPHGSPGDRLWVRETWRAILLGGIKYRADGIETGAHWKPSIFMPRWASRITLEITDVRVQRVQEITEADARAEGITDGGCLTCGEHEPCGCPNPRPDARDAFAWLWMSINEKRGYGWHENPWVWAISFKVVRP